MDVPEAAGGFNKAYSQPRKTVLEEGHYARQNQNLEARSDWDARRRQDHSRLRNLLAAEKGGPQRRARHRGRAPLAVSGKRSDDARRAALDPPRADRRGVERRVPRAARHLRP